MTSSILGARSAWWAALLALTGGPALAQEEAAKSERLALQYSVLGTAAPVVAGVAVGRGGASTALILVGAVIGPSLGHFYAEARSRAAAGIAIRGLLPLGVAAIELSSSDSDADLECCTATVIALALAVVDGVYDILTAPISARSYNQTHGFVVGVTAPAGTLLTIGYRIMRD